MILKNTHGMPKCLSSGKACFWRRILRTCAAMGSTVVCARSTSRTRKGSSFAAEPALVTTFKPRSRQVASRVPAALVDGAGSRRTSPAGVTRMFAGLRSRWMTPWLTGDPGHDELLLGISMDRLRKTYLEQVRQPIAHTPATLAGYLGRMESVRNEGFQIVREALDAQVTQALARRAMTTHPDNQDDGSGRDAVLAVWRAVFG